MPCCARCEGCGKQSNQVPATQAFQEKFAANVPADEQLNTVVPTWHDACSHCFLIDKHSLLSMLAWKKRQFNAKTEQAFGFAKRRFEKFNGLLTFISGDYHLGKVEV